MLHGRTQVLESLQAAFAGGAARAARAVWVRGASGVGKTALTRAFVERLNGEARVLAGRCVHTKRAPFESIEGWIRALDSTLAPGADAWRSLPPDHAAALVRLFPLFARAAPRDGATASTCDAQELRRRAFAALRALVSAAAEAQPLVLVLDDVQWADRDLVALVSELFRAPAPPVLFVGCYRDDEAAGAAPLIAALEVERQQAIDLLPLGAADARALALDRLGADDPATVEAAERVAREAAGNPLLIEQLARLGREGIGFAAGFTVDELLRTTTAKLSRDERSLLAVAALAAVSLDVDVAAAAAGVASSRVAPAVERLVAAHLVRVYGGRLEPFHDRIREAAARLLPAADRRTCHARIARELERQQVADVEAIATHFLEAGLTEAAARHALLGARRAREALAFDRAARLYRLAIEQLPADAPARAELYEALAESLAAAGLGGESAQAFLDAAALRAGDEALVLQRRAAEQYLNAGHFPEGVELLGRVLRAHGIELARTRGGALRSILWQRARLRLRGLGFRERPEAEVPGELLRRIDALNASSRGLLLVESLHSYDLHNHELSLALAAGEPSRVARALQGELTVTALQGPAGEARARALWQRATALADRFDSPRLSATLRFGLGLVEFEVGRYQRALEESRAAEALFRGRCSDAWWELAQVQSLVGCCLFYLGRAHEMIDHTRAFAREADQRGDLLAICMARLADNIFAWLADDDVGGARAESTKAVRLWSLRGRAAEPLFTIEALVNIALYAGDDAAAWKHIERMWPEVESSLFIRQHNSRIMAHYLRARAALAVGRLDVARRDIRLLRRLAGPVSAPLAHLLGGVAAWQAGDASAADAELARADEGLDAAGLTLLAASARRWRGRIRGGDEGAALVSAAEDLAKERGARAPARFLALLAPAPRDGR